jgi:hypothetical protein
LRDSDSSSLTSHQWWSQAQYSFLACSFFSVEGSTVSVAAARYLGLQCMDHRLSCSSLAAAEGLLMILRAVGVSH